VIITGSGSEEVAVEAMKLGAADYLIKDAENHWLKTVPITVNNAIKAKRVEQALEKAHEELERRVETRTADLLLANEQLRDEIDRRRRAQEALRESEERFRSLTETTSEWIWEIDSTGIITYSSPRVTELLGYNPDEIVGMSRFALMPPEEAKRVAELYESFVQSHKPFRDLESSNEHRNVGIRILLSSGVPYFDSSGTLVGYRGIDLDITERRKGEELLLKSERLAAIAGLASGYLSVREWTS